MHKALKFAIETALDNGYQCDGIRYRDASFAEQFPCYLIAPGLVVYEDEPDCVVSVGADENRFIAS
jgi:hypothetical protein